MEFFALNFRTLKDAFGYTYEDMQGKFGVSRATVRNYLAGENKPGRKKLEEIAKGFGTSYETLTSVKLTWQEAEALAKRAASLQRTRAESIAEDNNPEGGYQYVRSESVHAKSDDLDIAHDQYDIQLAVHVGATIDRILTKHQVAREVYARKELKRSERTLQRIIRGEIMATLPIVVKIALDFGESLDLFRPGVPPKGHWLQLLDAQTKLISDMNHIIESQKQLIKTLTK